MRIVSVTISADQIDVNYTHRRSPLERTTPQMTKDLYLLDANHECTYDREKDDKEVEACDCPDTKEGDEDCKCHSSDNIQKGCPYCGSSDYKVRARCKTAPTICTCGKQYYNCAVHHKPCKGQLPDVYGGWSNICLCDLPAIIKKYPPKAVKAEQDAMIAQYKEQAMFEDQKRRQPRDCPEFNGIQEDEDDNRAVHVEDAPTVGQKRTVNKRTLEGQMYQGGSKSKVSNMVYKMEGPHANFKPSLTMCNSSIRVRII